jgi:Ni,Fe-hydrogenase I large subunit
MANIVMSHILHFYHLTALDYVDATKFGSLDTLKGLPLGAALIDKGPTCPAYNHSYYNPSVNVENVMVALFGAGPWTVLQALGLSPTPFDALTPYLAGQYVRALKFRRMAQQLVGMFAGRGPHVSNYTWGGMTTEVPSNVLSANSPIRTKFEEIMWGGPGWVCTGASSYPTPAKGSHPINGLPIDIDNPHPESILGFIGKPSDFNDWLFDVNGGGNWPGKGGNPPAPGAAMADPTKLPPWSTVSAGWQYGGTYLFDLVGAAHFFPTYFYTGTCHGRLLAWGCAEGSFFPTPGGPFALYPDGRLVHRGRAHVSRNTGQVMIRPADHNQVYEFTANSWYNDPKGDNPAFGRHPWVGRTRANPSKAGAYTFAKTPRYNNANGDFGHPVGKVAYEVGPLARMYANCEHLLDAVGLGTTPGPYSAAGVPGILDTVAGGAVMNGDLMCYYPGVLYDAGYVLTPMQAETAAAYDARVSGLGYIPAGAAAAAIGPAVHPTYIGDATLDRHAARGLEALYIAKNMAKNMFSQLTPGGDSNTTRYYYWAGKNNKVPRRSKGVGLTEAPRGALAHWCLIGKAPKTQHNRGRVSKYQIITPTAWNVSPKDPVNPAPTGMGPIERSITDTNVTDNTQPVEIMRVVHSFDICCACTVHMVAVKDGKKVKVASVRGGISQFDHTECTVKK